MDGWEEFLEALAQDGLNEVAILLRRWKEDRDDRANQDEIDALTPRAED